MINDTLRQMELDFAKNLHGHVRVELRDRWTGRIVDSTEKDNLVTNALAKIYKSTRGIGSGGLIRNWFTPLYSAALGGIFLFDSTLTESASNYMFPGSAKLVGFAGQGSDTSQALAGSYNAEESVLGASSFTSVWDFGTSQANGAISSVARTSSLFTEKAAGGRANVFDTSYMGPFRWGGVMDILGYDATNKYLYLALQSAQTYNGATYTTDKIYRAYVDFETQSLLTQYFVPNPDKWTAITTVSSSTDGTSNAYLFTYDPNSNNFYYGATGSTKKIYLIAMDGTRSTVTLPVNLNDSFNLVATSSYYWYIPSSGNSIYIVPKANPANTSSVSLDFSPRRLIAMGDCIMVAGSNAQYTHAIVYPDGTVKQFNTTSAPGNSSALSDYAGGSYARPPMFLDAYMILNCATVANYPGDPYGNTCYLGTIANLDNPVTKSSSVTMKITYTLTEA